jgi:hypothetical protein
MNILGDEKHVEKYNFPKNHWLFQKEGKQFKSFEFPPQLSLKNFIQYSS